MPRQLTRVFPSSWAVAPLLGLLAACGSDPSGSSAGSGATAGRGGETGSSTTGGTAGSAGSEATAGSHDSQAGQRSAAAGAPTGTPNEPVPAAELGWWRGETDSHRDLIFHTTNAEVDAALLEISVNLGGGICHTSLASTQPAPIADEAFSAGLALEGSDFVGKLSGSFPNAHTAQGRFEWSGAFILCGATLAFGTGFSGKGTWTATPIDCPFKDDGTCDEPTLCPTGSDALDCTDEPDEPDEPPCSGDECECEFANDGECDEPDLCDPGTDEVDCNDHPGGEGGAGSGGAPGVPVGEAGASSGGGAP